MALSQMYLRYVSDKYKCLFSLQEQYGKVLSSLHTASSFRSARSKRSEAKSVILRSSRPLKEDVLGSVPEKPDKPRRYVVFGDVTVDHDTFAKMQEESNNIREDFEDEELNSVLQNSEMLYNIHESEERGYRSFLRRKTLERKLFPRQIEPALLTWAARDQIRYLHGLDPEEWTPEEISKHFPVSPLGAQKLIRSSFKYVSKEKIEKFDQAVHENWKKLRKGEISGLDPSLQEKLSKRQLKANQALPNPALPLPPPRDPNPAPFLLDDPNKPVGEFYALVKPYIDLTRKNEEAKKEASRVTPVDALSEESKTRVAISSAPTLDDEVGEDERKQRLLMRSVPHVTHKQFQENLKEELRKNQHESEEDARMLAWMESQKFLEGPENVSHNSTSNDEVRKHKREFIQKYKENVKVMFDTPKVRKDLRHREAYVYDSSTGYQHPFGKSDGSMDRIRIDHKTKKENGLYKVGDSFYSEDGEFVFRVFMQ